MTDFGEDAIRLYKRERLVLLAGIDPQVDPLQSCTC